LIARLFVSIVVTLQLDVDIPAAEPVNELFKASAAFASTESHSERPLRVAC
jgi:hypothetical protein